MRRRLVDAALLVAFLVGAALTWDAGHERARLEASRARILANARGRLEADPSRVRVVPIDTGEPLHFQWLIRVPAGLRVELTSRAGTVVKVERTDPRRLPDGPRELYVGVRLSDHPSGGVYLERRFPQDGDGRQILLHDGKKRLRSLAGRVRVEGLAAREIDPVTLDDPKRPVVLVRFTLPDDMLAAAKGSMSPRGYAQIAPVLCELALRPLPPEGEDAP